MHSNAVLLLTFVASASAAIDYRAIPHVRNELNLPRATPVNEARDADPSKCASEALSIAQSIPTPPPAVVSDLAKNPQTDPCHFSIPQSISAEYASYSSEVLSWYNGHKGELSSLASECSVANSYTSIVNVCSTDKAGAAPTGSGSGSGSGPNTAAAAPTGSSSGSDSSASKTSGSAAKSTNAGAARETGMAFAALAAAGIAAIL